MKNKICLIVVLFSISTCYSQTAEEYFDRGNSKTELNDYKGAIADFSKAIELNPDAITYYNRGVAKYKLKDSANACLDLKNALKLGLSEADEIARMVCN